MPKLTEEQRKELREILGVAEAYLGEFLTNDPEAYNGREFLALDVVSDQLAEFIARH